MTESYLNIPDAFFEELAQIDTLESFGLYSLNLEAISDALGDLTGLKHLQLSKLHNFPGFPADAVMEKLVKLETLDISENGLKEVPAWLRKLPALRSLNLAGSGFSAVPEPLESQETHRIQMSVDRLPVTLKFLDISSNQGFIGFGDRFKPNNERRRAFHKNGFEGLPEALGGHLPELRTLICNNNHLIELPESLSKLQNLEQLELQENDLAKLPSWLVELPKLEYLDLSMNDYDYVHWRQGNWTETAIDLVGLGKLKALQYLHVQDMGEFFKTLPSEIGDLDQLMILDAAKNYMKTVPASLTRLSNLYVLDLQMNSFTWLPNLSEMPRLERLNLEYGLQYKCVPAVRENMPAWTDDYEDWQETWKPYFGVDHPDLPVCADVAPTPKPSAAPTDTDYYLPPSAAPTRRSLWTGLLVSAILVFAHLLGLLW